MTLLDNEHFLTELPKFFHRSRTGGPGSVVVTMKRYDGHTKPKPRDGTVAGQQHQELKCLMRAKLGTQTISTVVNPKDINKFQLAYASLLKLNMDNLKKREKKTDVAKKPKPTAAATQ